MKPIKVIGLLLVFGIGFYVYSIFQQVNEVAEVCSVLSAGTPVGKMKELKTHYSLELRGPFELKDKPGTLVYIYCSDLTMCETSCSIEVKDGKVKKSEAFGV